MNQLFASGGQSMGLQLQHQSFQWYSGLISLQSQGTLRSLLQHHSSKASILQCSPFFIVQLSHPYMTAGKSITLTRQTFVSKLMSTFLMCYLGLSYLLPRSKHLLISWLQSPSAVVLRPKKIKFVIVSPFICHEVMGLDAMILVFWLLNFRPTFSLPFSPPSKGSLVPFPFLL